MINFLVGLLFTVDVICALLLVGIILIQQSKSGGGLGAISGGMSESVFGAAAGNVITKTTVVLATVFLVSTLLLAMLSRFRQEPETLGDRLREQEATSDTTALEDPPEDTEQADGADIAEDISASEAGEAPAADEE